MSPLFLSVIVPAYNEAKNFKTNRLSHLYEYLAQQSYSFELILVDDGSSDETLKLLHQFAASKSQVKIIANPHYGKAPTVTTGMLKAHGRLRLFTDFDQATPIKEIEKLLPFIDQGYQVVIGSREVKGAKREKEPWYRHLMGRGFNLIVQALVTPGIQDTQCGFKLFTAQATQTLFPKLSVYKTKTIKGAFTGAFDVELLFLANKVGYKIAEVPIYWQHFATERVSPIKDSLRMFADVLKIRLNDLLGKYA